MEIYRERRGGKEREWRESKSHGCECGERREVEHL
jgi:hypothetical protein